MFNRLGAFIFNIIQQNKGNEKKITVHNKNFLSAENISIYIFPTQKHKKHKARIKHNYTSRKTAHIKTKNFMPRLNSSSAKTDRKSQQINNLPNIFWNYRIHNRTVGIFREIKKLRKIWAKASTFFAFYNLLYFFALSYRNKIYGIVFLLPKHYISIKLFVRIG